MVKNTIGGKKGKMLSKKQHGMNSSSFPISRDEEEIYVCVTKIFGGGVFEVVDKNKLKYKAYLRGKMKGSNKRHNLVSMNSILLVGIRSDLSDKFSVDILFVYDNHHIQTLSLDSHFPISLLYFSQGFSHKPISDNDLFIISDNNYKEIDSDFSTDILTQTQIQIQTQTETDFDFENI
jgi:hypothetical protein